MKIKVWILAESMVRHRAWPAPSGPLALRLLGELSALRHRARLRPWGRQSLSSLCALQARPTGPQLCKSQLSPHHAQSKQHHCVKGMEGWEEHGNHNPRGASGVERVGQCGLQLKLLSRRLKSCADPRSEVITASLVNKMPLHTVP